MTSLVHIYRFRFTYTVYLNLPVCTIYIQYNTSTFN